ncbi:hypothetical protein AAFF_G00235490 [Aldrovandia affinis]|uniref:Uncharacterized protein n=1 Tax=Aldrovandia affinis TaxID=143900 RepID=A0AAD7SV65_9TELE|nr:hypothetical protein AAFF_G00235490 [Aldrovandia affinis]
MFSHVESQSLMSKAPATHANVFVLATDQREFPRLLRENAQANRTVWTWNSLIPQITATNRERDPTQKKMSLVPEGDLAMTDTLRL